MNNDWKVIPGYEKYEMNIKTTAVRSVKDKTLKSIGRSGIYFFKKNKRQKGYCIPRLLFCVLKGINPENMGRDVVVVMEKGVPKPYLVGDYRRLIHKRCMAKKRQNASIENTIAKYKESRETIDLIIRSLETNNYEELCNVFFSKKDMVVESLCKRRYIQDRNTVEDFVSDAIVLAIEKIKNGADIIVHPSSFIYKTAMKFMKIYIKDRMEGREFIKEQYYDKTGVI